MAEKKSRPAEEFVWLDFREREMKQCAGPSLTNTQKAPSGTIWTVQISAETLFELADYKTCTVPVALFVMFSC